MSGVPGTVYDQTIDAGGIRTRYRHAGEAGSPVVLIHGLGDIAALSSFFTRVR
jgi:pimeloyl-ACP methyl ester carboxylesterase